jgi:hypothetical protein
VCLRNGALLVRAVIMRKDQRAGLETGEGGIKGGGGGGARGGKIGKGGFEEGPCLAKTKQKINLTMPPVLTLLS